MAAAAITSLVPDKGSILGGAAVTITGTDFGTVTSVTFDGIEAVFVIDGATQITAYVPPGVTVGDVDVVATNPEGSDTDTFTNLDVSAAAASLFFVARVINHDVEYWDGVGFISDKLRAKKYNKTDAIAAAAAFDSRILAYTVSETA